MRSTAERVAAPPPTTDPPAIRRSSRTLAWLLIVGGAIGFAAACTLLLERVALLEDPSYVPSCSINPILSCGSVMASPQAEAFGFPNPILGVAGFAVVVTIGMALAAGAAFRRWFWLGLQAGTFLGVAFIHWLIVQSLYRIGALCPYCMVVWVVTIPLFWYTTLHNLRAGNLPGPAPLRPLISAAKTYHGVMLTAWYLVIGGLITARFWDYWSSLLT